MAQTSSRETAESVSSHVLGPFRIAFLMLLALVLYSLVSSFLPSIERYVNYRLFVLTDILISFLLMYHVEAHVFAFNRDPDEGDAPLPRLRLETVLVTAVLSLLFLFVIATFHFPGLLLYVNLEMLSLAVFSATALCVLALEQTVRKRRVKTASLYNVMRTESLRRKFSLSLGILFLAVLVVLAVYLYPQVEVRLDVKGVFLAIVCASLIGLLSVRRDISMLLLVLRKARMVASGKSLEKIDASSTPEMRELADVFNLVISDLQDKMRELEDAKQRIETLVARIGKAVSSTGDVGDLLRLILEVSLDTLQGDHGGLWVVDSAGGDPTWHFVARIPEAQTDEADFRGRLQAVLAGGAATSTGTSLTAALRQKDRTVGVLGIERMSGRHGFDKQAQDLFESIADQAALAIGMNRLQTESDRVYLEIISTMALAIEAKDPYTKGHSQRTMRIAGLIADRLKLSETECQRVRDVALLHDIGKVGIPDGVLNKPGALMPAEYSLVQRHADLGAYILTPVTSLRSLLSGIRGHHERCDGKGYPDGLIESQIDIAARIVCVADAVDAMFSERPYRRPFTLEQIKTKVREGIGTQFSREPAETLLQLVEEQGESALR